METITFKFVGTSPNGLQKFYKSSEILTSGFNRLVGKPYTFNAEKERERLYPEYKTCVRDDGFEIICISNASTHSEKLAFAGAKTGDRYFRLEGQIEGIHTMSIYGGDLDACWDDEKYLRLIARHNGYSQNKVEIIL